jgi:hypothetical protein
LLDQGLLVRPESSKWKLLAFDLGQALEGRFEIPFDAKVAAT